MEAKHDYNKEMEAVISSIMKEYEQSAKKPRLLLHACCGPCSSAILERLCSVFDITILFYNPNIYPAAEYERRRQELYDFAGKFSCARNVHIAELPYDDEEFYSAVNVRSEPALAAEKERGERCRRCYELRLKKTYDFACENSFDYFTTTLSISPFKDSEKINETGRNIEAAGAERLGHTVRFLFADFKKKNGFKRSLELSQEYELYRQEYCGCVYSMKSVKEKE